MSVSEKVIPLVATHASERRQKLNHAVPGLALLIIGVEALSGTGDEHIMSAWLNIIIGAAVLVAVVRDFRKKSPGGHSLIGWVDVLAGCVIIVEGLNHFHPNKGFQPAYLYWLAGFLTILLGIFHERVSSVRRITLSDSAFSIRKRLFSSASIPWNSIDSMRVEPRALIFQTKDGGARTISLKNVENVGQIREALRAEASLHGIGFPEASKEADRVAAGSARGNL